MFCLPAKLKALRAGFSLLELLLVLAVLGILAGLAGSGASAVQQLSVKRSREALLLELVTACRFYRLENGAWPVWLAEGIVELEAERTDWEEDLQPYMESPAAGLESKAAFRGQRIYLLVDLDGDHWIPGTLLEGIVEGEFPERIAGLAAACSLGEDGLPGATTWAHEAE